MSARLRRDVVYRDGNNIKGLGRQCNVMPVGSFLLSKKRKRTDLFPSLSLKNDYG